jgi:hypothetical protein
MLAMAVWCTLTLDDWTTLALQKGAHLPSLFLFIFPGASALVAGALYWNGRAARVDDAKRQRWEKWGRFLTISYCVGLLLLQGVLVVRSLDLDVPLDVSAVARALGVLLAITCLLAINEMPKLPWFEQRFALGGNLGPIYGPRFIRVQARIVVVIMIAVIAYSLAVSPAMRWQAAPYILIGTALVVVWSIAWRCHLGRKWKREQMAAR